MYKNIKRKTGSKRPLIFKTALEARSLMYVFTKVASLQYIAQGCSRHCVPSYNQLTLPQNTQTNCTPLNTTLCTAISIKPTIQLYTVNFLHTKRPEE
jgi:hypothetical protein